MNSFQDSVIKILLSIDILQELLINLLFEKLPEFLYDSFGSDGISIPRLIINQLKWLDLVLNGKELTSKMMQLVAVAPADIQQHVISSLPEILEDAEHNDVAKELSSLLKQNTKLMVPILDAFSSLNLSAELLTEVRQWVMSTLCAVDLEVVPVIVKFVLHTVTPSDALEEVIAALVTHVCSGYADEVDTALDVMGDLVSSHTAAVALHVVFIKGILDHLDNLNCQQIRKLFQILCALGVSPEGAHIQLATANLEYPALSPNLFRQVTSLLELARTCCEHSPVATAFYFDELADLVQMKSLDTKVMEHMRKTVLEDFQEDYVVDLDQKADGTHLFPVKAIYNLEDDESQSVAINLLPLLADKGSSSTTHEGRPVSPLCLCPFFRLLRLCIEDEFDGNLDEIDALLGCPLYLTDLEVVDKVESLSRQEQEFLCSLLFLAINWFIEVVNAFCKQPNADLKGKVLRRLQNITWLQSVLEKCLPACPGYIPQCASFDGQQMRKSPSVVPAVAAPKKAKKGKKRPLGDGKNSSSEASQIQEQLDSVPQETHKSLAEKEKDENSRPTINLSSFRPFFRELDIDVFTVLQSGLVKCSLLDSDMCTKATEVVQLGPTELVFLLDDLYRKTVHILTATKRMLLPKVKDTKSTEFSHLHQRTPQEVAQVLVGLLSPLCAHVENMHNYFQVWIERKANHLGSSDGAGLIHVT
ncbi:hypothetical protein GDO78_010554 [Eleutherodactylus coqui]|nr:hypothetical protein GDO78_010554 [Eleutherodactylus coqui]